MATHKVAASVDIRQQCSKLVLEEIYSLTNTLIGISFTSAATNLPQGIICKLMSEIKRQSEINRKMFQCLVESRLTSSVIFLSML